VSHGDAPPTGRLVVLSGPSGVGKDTVLQALTSLEPRLRRSVSCTTRPPRPGETDGVSYHFVDDATFRAMIDRDEFLEWAVVHGELKGTPRAAVQEALARGEDVILKIDVQGAAQVRGQQLPGTIFIFLMPPSLEELQERLRRRETEDEASLAVRESDARRELAMAEQYDHRVVNDNVERAAREILGIIARSRRRHEDGDG